MSYPYSAAIFDLDGTLLDTLDDLAAATNATLAAYGFPVRTREEVRLFVGNGVEKLMERALPDGHATVAHLPLSRHFRPACRPARRRHSGRRRLQ